MIMKTPRLFAIIVTLLVQTITTVEALQVAVIGTTGNIAQTAIRQLSKQNITTRCLLRHDISNIMPVDDPQSSREVAASLASLPNIEMIQGDVTDPASLLKLVQGCDAILALQGAPKPNVIKSLIPFLSNPEASSHPYMINYVGVQNIIDAAHGTPSVKRIIRITGKGEQPYSIVAILINMLGNLAKGWNYEGEVLLRKSGIDYTIIRPGLLKKDYTEPTKARGLVDNGGDMKVSVVSYHQIAQVCIESLQYDNTKKSTLTVMNVDENEGEEDYGVLLGNVIEDQRVFPDSLIREHRMGARFGFVGLCCFLVGVLNGLKGVVGLFL